MEIKIVSHEEFAGWTTKLSTDIKKYTDENNLRIDYVVPVLRSGAVPAVYIANNLNIIKFAPIQVKLVLRDGEEKPEVLLNSLDKLDPKRAWTLLVTEGNFRTGETVRTALSEIKKTLPKAKILLACVSAKSKDFPPEALKTFWAYDNTSRVCFP